MRGAGSTAASLAAGAFLPRAAAAQSASSEQGPALAANNFWEVAVSADRRHLELSYQGREWLSSLRVGLKAAGDYEWSDGSPLSLEVVRAVRPGEMTIKVRGFRRGEIVVHAQQSKMTVALQDPRTTELKGVAIEVDAVVEGGADPLQCRLDEEFAGIAVQQMASGRAVSRLNDGIFDRFRDQALCVSARNARFAPSASGFHVSAGTLGTAAPICAFKVVEQVYGSRLEYYTPFDKARWPEPPVGWCSFHYYGNVLGENDILRNAEALARDYGDFGLKYVLIDGGWQAHGISGNWTETNASFPHGMKWLAERIRALGLKPAIWLSEFGTDDENFYNAHKEWFLHDAEGNAKLGTWFGTYILDFSNPEVKQYLHEIYRTIAVDWGYDYFKLDGENATRDIWGQNRARAYNPAQDADTAFRDALEIIRQSLDSRPGVFLSACGPVYPTESIGIVQSARLGGDIVSFSPSDPSSAHSEKLSFRSVRTALEGMRRGYYTHNLAWYADPDGVLLRPPLTEEEVRTWFSIAGLTGQLLMLGDNMPALSAARRDIARKVMPPLSDIRPTDLYPQSLTPNVWALHIERSFGTWAVVGLFNWDCEANEVADALSSPLQSIFNHDAALLGGSATGPAFWELAENAQKALDENRRLEALPHKPAGLELLPVPAYLAPLATRHIVLNFAKAGLDADSEYLLFDFWKQKYVGRLWGEYAVSLPPHACQVLSVRPARGRPQLVGTDRHITMGGVELGDERWDARSKRLSLTVELVANYPTTLTLFKAGSRFIGATSREANLKSEDGLETVTLRLDRPTTASVGAAIQFA